MNRRTLLTTTMVALLGITLPACNWLTGTRKPPRPKQGLIVKVDRHKAALFINDEPVTLLRRGKENVIGLAPGRYRIALKKAGYFSRFYDVQVRRKAFTRLQVKLQPELD